MDELKKAIRKGANTWQLIDAAIALAAKEVLPALRAPHLGRSPAR